MCRRLWADNSPEQRQDGQARGPGQRKKVVNKGLLGLGARGQQILPGTRKTSERRELLPWVLET